MTIKHYQNKYNANKYIEVHYYTNRHVGIAQYIKATNKQGNTVVNYVLGSGGSKGIKPITKMYLNQLLSDYTPV